MKWWHCETYNNNIKVIGSFKLKKCQILHKYIKKK